MTGDIDRSTTDAPVPEPVAGSVRLYTLDEACQPLRLGESTLRKLIGNGTIPRHLVTRIGGRMFMTGDQIVRLIALGADSTLELATRQQRHATRKPRQPRQRKAADA